MKTITSSKKLSLEVDDFAKEVTLVRQNDELMALLAERSKKTERLPKSQVKTLLGLD